MNCVNCKNCKHYETEAERRCINPKPSWGYCLRAESRDGEPEDATSKSVAVDQEAYMAALNVREDFGCVQFEGSDGTAWRGCPVSKVREWEAETVERIRAVGNNKLNELSDDNVACLYREFSHQCYCAGWMDPRPDVVNQFVEWATTVPCDWKEGQ